jgi:hypothetical protein
MKKLAEAQLSKPVPGRPSGRSSVNFTPNAEHPSGAALRSRTHSHNGLVTPPCGSLCPLREGQVGGHELQEPPHTRQQAVFLRRVVPRGLLASSGP